MVMSRPKMRMQIYSSYKPSRSLLYYFILGGLKNLIILSKCICDQRGIFRFMTFLIFIFKILYIHVKYGYLSFYNTTFFYK